MGESPVVIFRSPTEQNVAFKDFPSSSLPETKGADFLFSVPEFGFVGVQRKELRDLVASLRDGRLAKEIGQMESLAMKVLVIEGRPGWTRDGESSRASGWSITQQNGLIYSLFLKNFLVLTTEDAYNTSRSILQLKNYLLKSGGHSSLERRPKAVGTWGRPNSREFAIHVLQSFPGVGPDLAKRIYDRFGLPLRWTIDVLELQTLDGIGMKKAATIITALEE